MYANEAKRIAKSYVINHSDNLSDFFKWVEKIAQDGKFKGNYNKNGVADIFSEEELVYLKTIGYKISSYDNQHRPLPYYEVSWE